MANIELDGANKKIKVDSGDLTLDVPGDIILDADGGDVVVADGGTNILKVTNSSSDVVLQPQVDAKDIIFKQYDGTTVATVEDNGTFNIPANKLAIGGTAVTSTAAELNILDGVTSTAAELNILDGVTSTAAELNIVDGNTSATSTTIADADRVVLNDNGTMVQAAVTDLKTYIGGAFVSLGSASGTTDVANVVFDDVFSNTYTRYMMMVDYMLPATANVEMRYKWRKSDSSDQTGGYVYSGLAKRHANTDNYSVPSGSATDSGVLTYNIQTGNGEHGVRALFDIYRPGTVDGNATMHYIVGRGTYRSYNDDSSQSTHFYVASNNYNTTAFTGIKVYFNSGNINSYKIRMYGVVT